MPSTTELDTPIATLRATGTSRLPFQRNVLLRSFVLERPAGNVIVYNSPGLSAAAGAVEDLGGASHLLINHRHEAELFARPDLDVPVLVHERDRVATARTMSVSATFDDRAMLADDLEVIPTPGHTAGTTCFLWDSGVHRFLFTGDFVWIEEGEWKAVVLDPTMREDYLDSLALVRDLDFDVLVPWGATDDGPCVARTDPDDRRERIDRIIERVRAGESR